MTRPPIGPMNVYKLVSPAGKLWIMENPFIRHRSRSIALRLDLDDHLGRSIPRSVDCSNYNAKALVTISPDVEPFALSNLVHLLLVALVFHSRDPTFPDRGAPEIEVRSADDKFGQRHDRGGWRLGTGAGRSTCNAPEFPTKSSPIPSS